MDTCQRPVGSGPDWAARAPPGTAAEFGLEVVDLDFAATAVAVVVELGVFGGYVLFGLVA